MKQHDNLNKYHIVFNIFTPTHVEQSASDLACSLMTGLAALATPRCLFEGAKVTEEEVVVELASYELMVIPREEFEPDDLEVEIAPDPPHWDEAAAETDLYEKATGQLGHAVADLFAIRERVEHAHDRLFEGSAEDAARARSKFQELQDQILPLLRSLEELQLPKRVGCLSGCGAST